MSYSNFINDVIGDFGATPIYTADGSAQSTRMSVICNDVWPSQVQGVRMSSSSDGKH